MEKLWQRDPGRKDVQGRCAVSMSGTDTTGIYIVVLIALGINFPINNNVS